MKFTHVLHALHCEPWLITSQFHDTLVEILDRHIAGNPSAGLFDAMKTPMAKMEIFDGVADIPIDGVVGKRLSAMEKSCGACGVEDIEENIRAALADKTVSHILLSIDSPGGTVSGTPELAALISHAARQKPVMAFTDGMMASAAYWLGCGASAIYATESAVVGSIGVYMRVLDQSRRAEMAGIKVEVFKAGAFKGAGVAGTSLSDGQRAQFQAQVDQIKSMFDAHVGANRGAAADLKTVAQGQVFIGNAALRAGLVDEIAGKEQAIADLKRHIRVRVG